MRIIHISDLHFWHITLNPIRLAGKRIIGMGNLILNRARKYRMENMPALLERALELRPDHVLITGDLTSTSLEEEFVDVRRALSPLNGNHLSITVIPGNHDRYTWRAARLRLFEKYFGEYVSSDTYPWLKYIGDITAILGLDASRPTIISARGTISLSQIKSARRLLEDSNMGFTRLIVACHYPVVIPDGVKPDPGHGLQGKEHLHNFLSGLGPHLYCHGHIHAGWTFIPAILPQVLCINPGAALKRRKRSGVNASFLEILLNGDEVEVWRHALRRGAWETERLAKQPRFFAKEVGE